MRRRHGDEFPVGVIEIMQFRVVGKLGVTSLRMLINMHLRYKSSIS